MSKLIRRSRTVPVKTPVSVAVPTNSRTISYVELPEWQKDNEYIVSGYRQIQNHWKGCFTSVYAYLHNETDFAVIAVFLSSAIFCLSASAFFHTSTCHSEEVATRCHALDYSGIVILTVGSFYPALHFAFFCQPFLQGFYILWISTIGLGAAYIVLNPEYAKPTHRGARTAVFIGLGLAGVVPVTHCLLTEGYRKVLSDLGFSWVLISAALYICGALLYANRFPECLAPGKFDYFFCIASNISLLRCRCGCRALCWRFDCTQLFLLAAGYLCGYKRSIIALLLPPVRLSSFKLSSFILISRLLPVGPCSLFSTAVA
ncbi:ADIPOR-like receptor SPBC12C2.09c [Mycena sanguinolenta]|uniref:ADIPOR-like receptor SPBC12C2.09c n=1 Tax=Mycena sanguinolenta TaxID=230812 RepID=A0A8H6XQ18_9AGAR|nr:ADIPOR-like receptor SPBC12C2.09c [Mycena sanguinolenta]